MPETAPSQEPTDAGRLFDVDAQRELRPLPPQTINHEQSEVKPSEMKAEAGRTLDTRAEQEGIVIPTPARRTEIKQQAALDRLAAMKKDVAARDPEGRLTHPAQPLPPRDPQDWPTIGAIRAQDNGQAAPPTEATDQPADD